MLFPAAGEIRFGAHARMQVHRIVLRKNERADLPFLPFRGPVKLMERHFA